MCRGVGLGCSLSDAHSAALLEAQPGAAASEVRGELQELRRRLSRRVLVIARSMSPTHTRSALMNGADWC